MNGHLSKKSCYKLVFIETANKTVLESVCTNILTDSLERIPPDTMAIPGRSSGQCQGQVTTYLLHTSNFLQPVVRPSIRSFVCMPESPSGSKLERGLISVVDAIFSIGYLQFASHTALRTAQ